MKVKTSIRLRGNLSGAPIVSSQTDIPKNLWAARAVCHVFPSYEKATQALEQNKLLTVSAIVVQSTQGEETNSDKQKFSGMFKQSPRFFDSFILAADEASAKKVEGLVFYPESLEKTDLFYDIADGDILDYQIPAGKFSLDLPEAGMKSRMKGAAPNEYVVTFNEPGICIVQERYTRMFLICGKKKNLMVDCGFGRGDLKKLQKGCNAGEWVTVLTHGHADHAACCVQFEEIYGNRINLENAGIFYPGIVHEIEDGMRFDLGGRLVTAVSVSGHSAKDFAFYVEPERILICGDSIATGPNYTMAKGGLVDVWIESLQALLDRKLPITRIYCSHREGCLGTEAIEGVLKGLLALKGGQLKKYGASVYNVGSVYWSKDGNYSFFYIK